VTFDDWVETVSPLIKQDALWKLEAYRLSLFLVDLAWHDVTKLVKDRRTMKLAGQLYDSVDSIGSNLAEGFSRGTGRERARFYEYSCGSAREARHHYCAARFLLGAKVTDHRVDITTQLTRLTLKMIPNQRMNNIKLSQAPSRNHVLT
jgi:four helix bundle protein